MENVNAKPGNGQVTITWDENQGATSYNIYWSTDQNVSKTIGTEIQNVASPYTLTGLKNDETHYFVVTAANSIGESKESEINSAIPGETNGGDVLEKVHLKFRVPKGKASNIIGMMRLLQARFDTLEIEINAADGEMSKQEYENIEETLTQIKGNS